MRSPVLRHAMSGTGVGHSTATVCFYTVSSTDELDGGTRHMELEGLGDIGERTTALDSLRYHPTPYPVLMSTIILGSRHTLLCRARY